MKNFLFGVHLHQPVDNLDIAIQEAVEKCYAPFFEIISKYPEFKLNLHCSGWLFETLKEKYSDVFENIKKSNIEYFSGGFYEPILAIIPREDRITQIQKLNNFIETNFNKTPKGLWLTERVWDDGIVPEIVESDIEYLVVDDYHFKSLKRIDGYYFTEESGKKIKVFPISKNLRYKLPFSKVEESIQAIKEEKFSLMFDDCEKFGLWPNTYKWVYQEKWLEKFIEQSLENLNLYHFNDYIDKFNPKGLVYFSNVSYKEMNEWDNGNFKNFFIKYKESNHLHKRMLEVSSKKSENLYKLQTNDVFWHGVFGGLYLPNLRDNAYSYLIKCEDEFENGVFIKDIDLDGKKEIKIKTNKMILIFNANGEIIEFDDRKNRFNFLNTLKRREEIYHFQSQKRNNKIQTIHNLNLELGALENELFFDRYFRYSFIDHLVENINLDSFRKDTYIDFCEKNYINKGLFFENHQLSKQFNINEEIDFEIINHTSYQYGLEFNFHFAHYDDLEITNNYIFDSYTKRKIVFDFEYKEMFYFFVNTISRDEKGFQKTIQSISIMFLFDKKTIKGKLCLK